MLRVGQSIWRCARPLPGVEIVTDLPIDWVPIGSRSPHQNMGTDGDGRSSKGCAISLTLTGTEPLMEACIYSARNSHSPGVPMLVVVFVWSGYL